MLSKTLQDVLLASGFTQHPADPSRYLSPNSEVFLMDNVYYHAASRTAGIDPAELLCEEFPVDLWWAREIVRDVLLGKGIPVFLSNWKVGSSRELPVIREIRGDDAALLDHVMDLQLCSLTLATELLERRKLAHLENGDIALVQRAQGGIITSAEVLGIESGARMVGGSDLTQGMITIQLERRARRAVFVADAAEALAWVSMFKRDWVISLSGVYHPPICRQESHRIRATGSLMCSALPMTQKWDEVREKLAGNNGVRAIQMTDLGPANDAHELLKLAVTRHHVDMKVGAA